MRLRDLVVPAFYAVSALVLVWDIVLAGQISQLRKAPRSFRALTALAGLLIAPAVLIAVTSATILVGRSIHVVAWVWPVTLVLFAGQALHAALRRLVHPLVGIPIAAYDTILAAAALTRHAATDGGSPIAPLQAIGAAHASTLGIVLGSIALSSPFALMLPLLAPAYPARYRISATLRSALALGAAAWSSAYAIELPRAYMAVRSYRGFDDDRLQERPEGDFAIGLRLYPALDDVPPPLAMRNDLELATTLGVGAVAVVVKPEGVNALPLDSIGNTVAPFRRDSAALVVALGYPEGARAAYRRSPQAYMQARIAEVERIARRMNPDYLLPAIDPHGLGAHELGNVPLELWQEYLRLSSRAVRRVNRRTRVGVSISTYTGRDSLLYEWAAAEGSPIDVVGFSLMPSFDGGASLDAKLRAAANWMRGGRKEHWVFTAGGFPLAHGERSQERAIWGVLAWATSQRLVRGVIVEGAGDYDSLTGLRAAGGRLRPATETVRRALSGLQETGQ